MKVIRHQIRVYEFRNQAQFPLPCWKTKSPTMKQEDFNCLWSWTHTSTFLRLSCYSKKAWQNRPSSINMLFYELAFNGNLNNKSNQRCPIRNNSSPFPIYWKTHGGFKKKISGNTYKKETKRKNNVANVNESPNL